MPLLIDRTQEGIYLEPGTIVFPRGVRLEAGTARRLRDIAVAMLAGMGLEAGEIARVRPCCARQVRNILTALEHPTSRQSIATMALTAVVRHGEWIRRIRGSLCGLLADEGADPEDIATVLGMIPRNAASVRWRLAAMPPRVASRASLAGRRAVQAVTTAQVERARSEIAMAEEERLTAARIARAVYRERACENIRRKQRERDRIRSDRRRQEQKRLGIVA